MKNENRFYLSFINSFENRESFIQKSIEDLKFLSFIPSTEFDSCILANSEEYCSIEIEGIISFPQSKQCILCFQQISDKLIVIVFSFDLAAIQLTAGVSNNEIAPLKELFENIFDVFGFSIGVMAKDLWLNFNMKNEVIFANQENALQLLLVQILQDREQYKLIIVNKEFANIGEVEGVSNVFLKERGVKLEDRIIELDVKSIDITIDEQEIVSDVKFAVLSIVSLGLYNLLWTYNAWRFLAQYKKMDIMPAARTLLNVFYYPSLFSNIQKLAKENNSKSDYVPLFLFIMYVGFIIIQYFNAKLGILALFAFVFLIPVNSDLNFLKQNLKEVRIKKENLFSDILILVFGIALWALIINGI
jgi:hypothetical protein